MVKLKALLSFEEEMEVNHTESKNDTQKYSEIYLILDMETQFI